MPPTEKQWDGWQRCMEEAGGKVGRRWQIAIAGGTRNGKVAGANGWHRRQRCMEVAGGKVGGRWQVARSEGGGK